ncbi:MAG: radical SAM protein [Candidatus Aenigmatarchaeota archaeon]
MKLHLLPHYKRILEGKEKPRFHIAKETGLLQKKIKEAWKILEKCELCERKCGVNRLEGEIGFCGVGKEWKIFGAHTHWGEEEELIPSATLFESGCTMRCCYCQNAPASIFYQVGESWTIERVAEWIESMAPVCKNINFVGGDPTPYVPFILKVLEKAEASIPIVFNSNAYYSEKTAELLRGIVDVYLLDFRYFKEECGRRLSQTQNYPEAAKRNHLAAKKDSDLMIRVLVMPGHIECDAKPVLSWIAQEIGKNTYVNILSQYRPCWRASRFPDINRPVSITEWESVVKFWEKVESQKRKNLHNKGDF